ncbi:hypothetical protein N0Y54_26240 [Nostoc punctiforme UO1]|uniref:hypothetical protein n=1 Tax=Nostoc punctiforme TaxID=272131 RepID=UPI0030ABED75
MGVITAAVNFYWGDPTLEIGVCKLNDLLESAFTVLVRSPASRTEGGTGVFEAGKALAELRDRRLYRSSHRTFKDYCRAKSLRRTTQN